DAVVVQGEHVGAAEAEDEEHLHGPSADAAYGGQALDDRLVVHGADLGERGELALDCPLREVAEREELCAREAGAAERLVRGAQDLLGREAALRARAQRADATEDRRGGLARELLVD